MIQIVIWLSTFNFDI